MILIVNGAGDSGRAFRRTAPVLALLSQNIVARDNWGGTMRGAFLALASALAALRGD